MDRALVSECEQGHGVRLPRELGRHAAYVLGHVGRVDEGRTQRGASIRKQIAQPAQDCILTPTIEGAIQARGVQEGAGQHEELPRPTRYRDSISVSCRRSVARHLGSRCRRPLLGFTQAAALRSGEDRDYIHETRSSGQSAPTWEASLRLDTRVVCEVSAPRGRPGRLPAGDSDEATVPAWRSEMNGI